MKRLVLLTLVLLLAVPAFAQGVAFQSSSLPRQMRGEGITETAGDVVVLATNTGTIKIGSSITIVYAAPVTASAATVLTVNAVGGVVPTASISGNTVTISFAGGDATFTQSVSTLVINNIRVDASGFSGGSTLSAFISGVSSQPGTFPVSFTSPSVIVGLVVKPSMTASAVSTSAVSAVTCSTAASSPFAVKVAENYPAAFTSFTDEVNFTPNLSASVSNGSIIQATVSGVPSGVKVTVTPHLYLSGTTTDNSANTSVQIAKTTIGTDTTKITALLASTATSAVSSTAAAGADQVFAVSFGGAAATTATGTVEDLELDFVITPVATTPLAAPVTITVTLKLIPGPTTISTTPKTPIARFADTTLGTFTIGTVGNCTSALLFPFIVTGIAGFDTSISISNTTLDPLGSTIGAAAQSGTCTLTMFPTPNVTVPGTIGTSVSVTSPTIAAGGTWATPLSTQTGLLGLEGYMFAVCNFLNAHGFAIITNGFGVGTAQTLSQGYLPLVVPTDAARTTAGQHESLGQ